MATLTRFALELTIMRMATLTRFALELALELTIMQVLGFILLTDLMTELMELTQVVWSYPQRSFRTRTLCIALSARCG